MIGDVYGNLRLRIWESFAEMCVKWFSAFSACDLLMLPACAADGVYNLSLLSVCFCHFFVFVVEEAGERGGWDLGF